MTVICLARHGRTAWHHPNRYTGSSDIPLDPFGAAQAERLGAWAAGQGFTGLACSPLRRAVQTAAPVEAATGLVALVDPRLRELDFGIAEGHTLDELRTSDPAMVERFVEDPATHHFPRGEAPTEAVQRFLAGLADLARTSRTDGPAGAAAAVDADRVLVVAHSTIIRLVTCAVLGLPLGEYRRRLPALDPAATVSLRFPTTPGRVGVNGSVALLAYNVPVPQGPPGPAIVDHQGDV